MDERAEIVNQVGERVANIYSARGFCCSESVISGMNGIFRGTLSEEQAAAIGGGFCHGMGGAGCLCGALAGAQVVLGLLLGGRHGGLGKKEFERLTRDMHDRFKGRFHATCCRLLRKRRKEKKGATCKELTQGGAEMATELLLMTRPEFTRQIDHQFLEARESRVKAMARKVLGG